jgi:hypothetical protein
MERTLSQEVLNSVDVNRLLRRYKPYELSVVFKVTDDYVHKTARRQKELGLSSGQPEQEMNYGRNNQWKELKETALFQQIMNR